VAGTDAARGGDALSRLRARSAPHGLPALPRRRVAGPTCPPCGVARIGLARARARGPVVAGRDWRDAVRRAPRRASGRHTR
jgi:hypothetical protein